MRIKLQHNASSHNSIQPHTILFLLSSLNQYTMAKTYKVGILGNQADTPPHKGVPNGMFGGQYGVEVFDLTTEQICSLLENPDTNQSVQASRTDFPAPVLKYKIMGGGRFYPTVSREELCQVVKDIELLISRYSTEDYWGIFGSDFYQTIFSENVATKCKMIVARVVGKKRTTSTRLGRSTTMPMEDFLKTQGLNFDSINFKGNFFIITDKSAQAEKKQKKGTPTNEVSISRVQSELAGEELKLTIINPAKETATAGKAIVGLGARLGRWFSSLVH